MEIYQGEPVGFELNGKDDEGRYIPSLDSDVYEAMLLGMNGVVAKSWTTADGSMSVGQKNIDGEIVGFISWDMTGKETADLVPTSYTLEVAKVIDPEIGRAIGVLTQIVTVNEAKIRRGV